MDVGFHSVVKQIGTETLAFGHAHHILMPHGSRIGKRFSHQWIGNTLFIGSGTLASLTGNVVEMAHFHTQHCRL